jgi:hypothetical protein
MGSIMGKSNDPRSPVEDWTSEHVRSLIVGVSTEHTFTEGNIPLNFNNYSALRRIVEREVSQSDGTSHHGINKQVEVVGLVDKKGISRLLMLGVDTHVNHTTESQIQGLDQKLGYMREVAAQIPERAS